MLGLLYLAQGEAGGAEIRMSVVRVWSDLHRRLLPTLAEPAADGAPLADASAPNAGPNAREGAR